MRRAPLIALLLLAAGCLPRGTTASGNPATIGVLVQATTGRCTTVLIGVTPHRVCVPRGKTPRDSADAPPDSARADSVRVAR